MLCNLSCVYEMHNYHLLIVVTDIFAPGLDSAETLGCVPHWTACAPSLRVSLLNMFKVRSSLQSLSRACASHSLDAVET